MKKTLTKTIAAMLFISLFITNPVKSQAEESTCDTKLKWVNEKPLQMQEYILLNTSGKIFDKFIEINSQEKVSGKDRLWSYKILAIGNHMLMEQPIQSPRIKSITSSFSDSATQMIRGTISPEKFKLQVTSLVKQAKAIDKDLPTERFNFLEKDTKQIEAIYNCVIVAAMFSASAKDK